MNSKLKILFLLPILCACGNNESSAQTTQNTHVYTKDDLVEKLKSNESSYEYYKITNGTSTDGYATSRRQTLSYDPESDFFTLEIMDTIPTKSLNMISTATIKWLWGNLRKSNINFIEKDLKKTIAIVYFDLTLSDVKFSTFPTIESYTSTINEFDGVSKSDSYYETYSNDRKNRCVTLAESGYNFAIDYCHSINSNFEIQ